MILLDFKAFMLIKSPNQCQSPILKSIFFCMTFSETFSNFFSLERKSCPFSINNSDFFIHKTFLLFFFFLGLVYSVGKQNRYNLWKEVKRKQIAFYVYGEKIYNLFIYAQTSVSEMYFILSFLWIFDKLFLNSIVSLSYYTSSKKKHRY